LGNSTVRVPVNTVYYAIAAAGILTLFVLVAWYRNSSGESANRNDNARQQPLVVEPGETPLSGKPESNGTSPDLSGTKGLGGSESSRLAKPVATSKSSASSPSSVAVKSTESSKFGVPPRGAMGITARGWLAADPREPGLNYLKLGEFFQTESEDAVVFLAENGAEAFALAIDPTRLGVNNSDPTKSTFKLYAARGITTDEYSKKMTAKTNTEATVARLGARWQKERKGSSNFGKPGWEKFK